MGHAAGDDGPDLRVAVQRAVRRVQRHSGAAARHSGAAAVAQHAGAGRAGDGGHDCLEDQLLRGADRAGGLQGIPRELTEAAEVDGATRVQSFFRIILPLLAPSLAVAFIFRSISAVQVFDIPYTFIQQAPAQGLLETLGVYIYRTSIEFLDFGYAATLSVALFAVSLAVTAIYIRFVRDGAST
ncbi:carbohydrate ABC transporter permease [Deinococcus radiopugnans]|uniref:carbohydrate ABC transporter permease n=1 Tax=Deinococcus radiopugnans TaxID=57497 RepID=UPI0036157165